MGRKVVIAGVLIMAVLAGIWGSRWFVRREEGITATGTIEVTRFDVTPKVGGYIVELAIKEGDKVSEHQVVARITRPDLQAQVQRDEAALQKAEVQLQDLVKGARNQELAEAEAGVATAEAVFEKARADYGRFQELYRQGAVSRQQMEAATVSYESAQGALDAARARLSLAAEGNRPDVIEAQRLEVARSKASLEMTKTQLDDTRISSPGTGLVLSKNFEQGEYVNAGAPIATIGDLNDCWVKIYIPSTQLGLLYIGQPANVKVDSFPDRVFSGEIREISQNAEFMPRQSLTQHERANMVFAVKVRVNNAEGSLKPGMPADVIIP
ncbi:MAG TPA: hypothetical protein DEA44_13395 [Firmicutes bacterium]|nr:hypothetical protein [Bacillota bacterium]